MNSQDLEPRESDAAKLRGFSCTAAVDANEFGPVGSYPSEPSRVWQAPPARTAPRGLAGLFDGSGGAATNYQPLDTDSLAANIVLVHVYDLGGEEVFQKINRFSTVNDRVLVGGLYHAGAEVYGVEWAYGSTQEPGGGVYGAPPRLNPQHTYRATVVMGPTSLSKQEVNDALQELRVDWKGTEYNLLHHNCLDFANAFCCKLGVGRMPGWIDRFGRTASSLDNFRNAAAERLDQTKDLVRSFSSDVEAKLRSEDSLTSLTESAQASAETLGDGLSRWGRNLFGALSRALGDEKQQGRERKAGSLQESLRSRGGITRPTPQPAAEKQVDPASSQARKAETSPVDEDAFLLRNVTGVENTNTANTEGEGVHDIDSLAAEHGEAPAPSDGYGKLVAEDRSPSPGSDWMLLGKEDLQARKEA
eukprot:TRINITY_DN48117_c0_g1_i1.p1 TRINITY_DN48117_c0_g1~~TRINITY_DN48117_c0_g1_i1.p1  ORF type:complete len:418 (-),score=92.65 TRINITY_DN48117_c0_g1_i1:54-1307(-)